jgi:hypothetical protein
MENRSFVLNRLVYDCHYVDFIKQLSLVESSKVLQEVLQKLNLPCEQIEPLVHFSEGDRTNLAGENNDARIKMFMDTFL